jgi:hypothetical protein
LPGFLFAELSISEHFVYFIKRINASLFQKLIFVKKHLTTILISITFFILISDPAIAHPSWGIEYHNNNLFIFDEGSAPEDEPTELRIIKLNSEGKGEILVAMGHIGGNSVK